MVRNPQRLWEKLEPADIAVLGVIERLSKKFEYVPVEVLEKRLQLPPRRVLQALDRLNKSKLVKRGLGSVIGYSLTFYGLNVLAFDGLHRRGIVEALGDRIGVGKEGEVYLGLAPSGERVVVKFHREGRSSFQRIRRLRSYLAGVDRKRWHDIAKLLGEREFKILVVLEREGAMVPRPIAWNRNAVVQEYIPGVELYRVRELDEDVAKRVLEDVIETIRIAYRRVGVVHGDLSEYNVLVAETGRGYVIDWPQYVYKDEPHAGELLERDVRYITSFFKRKFNINIDYMEVMAGITGGSP